DLNAMQTYWKDGLNIEGGDDAKFKFKIGGYFMSDFAYIDGDKNLEKKVGEFGSGTEFRRARVSLSGTIYDRIDFKTEYDFSDGSAKIQDAYFRINDLPWVGSLKVGHFKEPFSLAETVSARDITFIERSHLKDAFIPSRNMGLMVQDTAFDKRMTWAFGGFRETDDQGKGFGDSQYNMTMRFTGLPWYEESGRKLLHLGLSYSHKFRNDDPVRFRSRPEAHLAPRFVDTKDLAADGVDLLNPELAMVYGPFSLSAEYTHAFVSAASGNSPEFSGYYVETSYFLTGEYRPYKDSTGAFASVKPKRDFDGQGGWGAWEVGMRYSSIDLQDGAIKGGKLMGLTTGLNWYLNPSMRIMANYSLAQRNILGDANIFQVRAQVAF
ncbi:MAG: OprO/OprP family phosphate-selective porin, partial [Candidatus Binatia bacterium]